MLEVLGNPNNYKLAIYVMIALIGLLITYKASFMLWSTREKLQGSARMLVIVLLVESLSNTVYFAWWTTENLAGHPPWMLAHATIIGISFLKLLGQGLLLWLWTHSSKSMRHG